jgi:hypothetical protein
MDDAGDRTFSWSRFCRFVVGVTVLTLMLELAAMLLMEQQYDSPGESTFSFFGSQVFLVLLTMGLWTGHVALLAGWSGLVAPSTLVASLVSCLLTFGHGWLLILMPTIRSQTYRLQTMVELPFLAPALFLTFLAPHVAARLWRSDQWEHAQEKSLAPRAFHFRLRGALCGIALVGLALASMRFGLALQDPATAVDPDVLGAKSWLAAITWLLVMAVFGAAVALPICTAMLDESGFVSSSAGLFILTPAVLIGILIIVILADQSLNPFLLIPFDRFVQLAGLIGAIPVLLLGHYAARRFGFRIC